MQIKNKRQMYDLLQAGRFGNIARQWNSLDDLDASGYEGLVSMRSREISNPVRLYHVPKHEMRTAVANLTDAQRMSGLVFSEAPPDHERTIQGEYDGHCLTYSFAPLPMRLAFDQQRLDERGLAARMTLRRHLEPGDFDWLHELLDEFPGSVIEFTAFRVPVGVLPGSKMLVWEVRHY